MVKNLPANQETQVLPLGLEDSLEKEMRTHPVFLLGKSMDRGAWGATVPEVTKESDRTLTKQQQQTTIKYTLYALLSMGKCILA